jgi:hypothetical protein
MRQKGYWIDMALLAAIVICLVLIALRYLQGWISSAVREFQP